MQDSGFDRQRSITASLVGVLIGTIVVAMLGLTFTGHMKMTGNEVAVVAAR